MKCGFEESVHCTTGKSKTHLYADTLVFALGFWDDFTGVQNNIIFILSKLKKKCL